MGNSLEERILDSLADVGLLPNELEDLKTSKHMLITYFVPLSMTLTTRYFDLHGFFKDKPFEYRLMGYNFAFFVDTLKMYGYSVTLLAAYLLFSR